MTLSAADVAEILRIVEASNFDDVTVEVKGMKLVLRRGGAALAAADTVAPAIAVAAASAAPATASAAPAATAAAPERPKPAIVVQSRVDGQVVVSPMLGTFYRAPKPGAPPFVEVGTAVDEDTVIGIIEVMKLMNSVRAGVRGRVIEILAGDGALVEYGEALLRVSRSE
jgi:acetyl-CoA carboxylase biotin carboxyl carrier protein